MVGATQIADKNYKIHIKDSKKTIYINYYRNEVTDQNKMSVFSQLLYGKSINTLGTANLNKIIKP